MRHFIAGATVDGFLIGDTIHAGSCGVICRVTCPDAVVPLVMKVPRFGPGEPSVTLVAHEAERNVLAALQGPHVPRLVATGDLSRLPYIVMEEVRGRPLEAWLARAPLAADELARLGAATAAALASVHAQRVIHLDLKPENVMVRDDGTAVLVDFGLAHHADFPDVVAEEVMQAMGSAPYVSPEQLLGIRDDPRSDLFSLGVALYELATGELPFGAPRTRRGLRRRVWRDPVPPRALVASVPPWLQEVILWCLEPDPHDRPASAADLASRLSDPASVPLGERSRRTRRAGIGAVLLRRIRAASLAPATFAARRTGPPPIRGGRRTILAAVASAHGDERRHQLLRQAVRQLVAMDPDARLTVVSVIDPSHLAPAADDRLLLHLEILRRWVEPLHLAPERVTFHVLESSRPGEAILDYVRANAVHHVVVGAPPRDDAPLRLLGAVSKRLAVSAPCDVTIVRYSS